MISVRSTGGSSSSSSLGGGAKRSFSMLGVNENETHTAKRGPGREYKEDGANIDTQQMVVSVTTINLPPPQVEREGEKTVAPLSKNRLANVPTRRDWAFTLTNNRHWYAANSVISSAENPYGNAVPIFTNLGGVPRRLLPSIKFVGSVGNAGDGKWGDEGRDGWGNAWMAGATTARNSSAQRKDPCTPFYVSPFPYIKKDENGNDVPGYTDSGEDGSRIDKYRGQPVQIQNTDMTSFFHHIQEEMHKFALKNLSTVFNSRENQNVDKAVIQSAKVERYHPAYRYAVILAYFNKATRLRENAFGNDGSEKDPAAKRQLVKHLELTRVELNNFWKALQEEQEAEILCLGCPPIDPFDHRVKVLDTKFPTINDTPWKFLQCELFLKGMQQEIYLFSITECQNFMRAFMGGVSRYGATPEGTFDYIRGFVF